MQGSDQNISAKYLEVAERFFPAGMTGNENALRLGIRFAESSLF